MSEEGSAARRPNGNDDPEIDHAAQLVSELKEEERLALAQQVMAEMEVSTEQRYLKFLIKRNDQGELEPAGEVGAKGVLRQMGRALKHAAADDGG